MSIKKQKARNLILLLIIVCGGFYSSPSLAADEDNTPKGVQVSPLRFDWKVKGGEEVTGMVNLKNFGSNPYKVMIQVEDFYIEGDTSTASFFVPDNNHPLKSYDVIDWISPSERELVLAPGEGREILFAVRVPQGTPTGGYYGVAFFKSEEDTGETLSITEAAANIKVNTRVGTLITLAVKGEEDILEQGRLDKFESVKNIYWDSPATLSAHITNSGNINFKMSGEMDLYKFGNKVAHFDVDPKMYYPDKKRIIENQWDFKLTDIGYYKAKIKLTSENNTVNVFGETSFWVIPWKLLALASGLMLSLWSVYYLGGRNEKRKKVITVNKLG